MLITSKVLKKYMVKRFNKDTVVRALVNKDLTNFNFTSNILFKFLVNMTFHLADAHSEFLEYTLEMYANCEEYVGSYCYRKIGINLNLLKVLKKISYFKNMMKREPCKSYIEFVINVKRFCNEDYIKNIKYLYRPKYFKFLYSYFF